MNDSIKFIPETFSKISLGYDKQEQNICTPSFVNGRPPINSIVINVPDKIITKKELIIPVCYVSYITQKRRLKYSENEGYKIYICKINDIKMYSGAVIKETDPYEIPDPFLSDPKNIEQLKKELEDASVLLDSDLNDGLAVVDYMNVDALQYVNIPMESGKYEIYITTSGLESNHRIVEIEIKK